MDFRKLILTKYNDIEHLIYLTFLRSDLKKEIDLLKSYLLSIAYTSSLDFLKHYKIKINKCLKNLISYYKKHGLYIFIEDNLPKLKRDIKELCHLASLDIEENATKIIR